MKYLHNCPDEITFSRVSTTISYSNKALALFIASAEGKLLSKVIKDAIMLGFPS